MKKEKGFTLIELLAVIVILAIIALITVPIIINVIYKAEKGAFEDSAYGVLDAGRLYYADKLADTNSFAGQTFTFPNDIKDLKLSGEKPGGGTLVLDGEGRSTLEIYDDKKRWCALKKEEDAKITIADFKDGECKETGGGTSPDPTPKPTNEPGPNPSSPPSPAPTDEPTGPPTAESCFTGTASKDKQNYTITGYTCKDKNVVIPSTIGGIKVTVIGIGAFSSKQLTNVVIPSTVVTIGYCAFAVNDIKNIVIPSGVIYIGEEAFFKSLEGDSTLKISDTVKYIGIRAFAVSRFRSVTIPGNVDIIDDYAFSDINLYSLTIAEGVKSIGESAFGENYLSSVTIPSSVINIGKSAFSRNRWSNESLHLTINKPENTLLFAPWSAVKVDYVG